HSGQCLVGLVRGLVRSLTRLLLGLLQGSRSLLLDLGRNLRSRFLSLLPHLTSLLLGSLAQTRAGFFLLCREGGARSGGLCVCITHGFLLLPARGGNNSRTSDLPSWAQFHPCTAIRGKRCAERQVILSLEDRTPKKAHLGCSASNPLHNGGRQTARPLFP